MLLAATGSGIFQLSTGSATATVAAFDKDYVSAVCTIDGKLLAAVRDQGIYESLDGGDSWELLLADVNARTIDAAPDGATYIGADPAAIYCRRSGVESFVEVSAIRALPTFATWSFPNTPHQGNIHHFAFSASHPEAIYAAVEVGGVLVSTDGGSSWIESREGIHLDVHSIGCAPGETDVLYTATGQGFFRSVDVGHTWDAACDGLESLYLVPLAVHPERSEIVFTAATHARPRYWRGRDGGARTTLYRSENGGDSWQPVMGGLPESLLGAVDALTIDPHEPDTIYAGTSDGQVLVSAALGDGWRVLAQGLPPILDFAFTD